MSWKNARFRYCYPETKDGVEHYYVVVHGKPVEVTKEIYEVMEPSYRFEYEMTFGKKAKRNKSIEQLTEQIELLDAHGKLPTALQVQSAEDEYFMHEDEKKEDRIFLRMLKEIDRLPTDQQSMIHSYVEETDCIDSLAERDSVSQRAIYYRRERLGKTIARRVRKGEDDE